MTGEITLRGKVLPVGGIKDKVLAAYRAGIHDIILPEENEKDLEDIPEDVRSAMRFHLVKHMDEVIPLALDGSLPAVGAGGAGGVEQETGKQVAHYEQHAHRRGEAVRDGGGPPRRPQGPASPGRRSPGARTSASRACSTALFSTRHGPGLEDAGEDEDHQLLPGQPQLFFVDLPGYGFAKVAQSERRALGRGGDALPRAGGAAAAGGRPGRPAHPDVAARRRAGGMVRGLGRPLLVVADQGRQARSRRRWRPRRSGCRPTSGSPRRPLAFSCAPARAAGSCSPRSSARGGIVNRNFRQGA